MKKTVGGDDDMCNSLRLSPCRLFSLVSMVATKCKMKNNFIRNAVDWIYFTWFVAMIMFLQFRHFCPVFSNDFDDFHWILQCRQLNSPKQGFPFDDCKDTFGKTGNYSRNVFQILFVQHRIAFDSFFVFNLISNRNNFLKKAKNNLPF